MFAFLSEYEGFGLTPLEALAAGVPIVVLDTPVAREVYGAAADLRRARRRRGHGGGAAALCSQCRPRLRTARARAPEVLARYSLGSRGGRHARGLERIAAPMTRLAIVIVNFNAREHLENCLASLTHVPPRTTHEIVVVDNASTDGSVPAVRDRFPAVA